MAARFPDDWPVREIWRQALEGLIVFWPVWSVAGKRAYGLVATRLGEKPSGRRVLVIEIASGEESDRWVHCITQLEAYAKANGATRIEIRGRAGWARSLPDYRLEKEPTLTKDI